MDFSDRELKNAMKAIRQADNSQWNDIAWSTVEPHVNIILEALQELRRQNLSRELNDKIRN